MKLVTSNSIAQVIYLTIRVQKNHDFFKKIKMIWFFWFKSDFFDLNQIFLIFFKSLIFIIICRLKVYSLCSYPTYFSWYLKTFIIRLANNQSSLYYSSSYLNYVGCYQLLHLLRELKIFFQLLVLSNLNWGTD